jgi:PPM family protein phosphatase
MSGATDSMGSVVRWDALTDCGKVRRNNEDSFLALAFNHEEFYYLGKFGEAPRAENDYIFAVADGMGGERSGEYASRIAVDKITSILPRFFQKQRANQIAECEEALRKVFDDSHRALTYLGASYPECSNMGATLSLIWVTSGRIFYAHIGDSRIYKLGAGGEWIQVSEDHTHVGWLQRSGKLSEREARTHPRKNALQRALGAGQQIINPQIGCMDSAVGDQFILCSDGLVDGLWDRQIRAMMERPDDREIQMSPARRLVQAAVEKSGQDNTTAVVVALK